MNRITKNITRAALIAALYIAGTLVSHLFGLSSGAIQVRISEALCILPAFTFSAVPGLFVGCFCANLLTGAPLWDIVLGPLATLLGALGTYYFGKSKYTAPIFPILTNTIIIPIVLKYVYGIDNIIWYFAATVFLGEFISCGIIGTMLYKSIEKTNLYR